MGRSPSLTILLCEDDAHEQLVRSYLKKIVGYNSRNVRPLNASRQVHGGNVGWVLREFPKQLQACRNRHAHTLLIVIIDADDFTVDQRSASLSNEGAFSEADPLVLLIPRRHVETWIRVALGEEVNETATYKKPAPKSKDFSTAASQIYQWVRQIPPPDLRNVPSLLGALPNWR